MSALILSFPDPLVASETIATEPRLRRCAPFAARRRYTLTEMIRLCGLEAYERRTAIDHLRLYARQNGLPLPRNARKHGGRAITGPDSIGARSLWDALEVDAWLDNPQPPQGGAAASVRSHTVSPPVPAPRHADMADRARLLAGAQ